MRIGSSRSEPADGQKSDKSCDETMRAMKEEVGEDRERETA
jgi:hypothetical protein